MKNEKTLFAVSARSVFSPFRSTTPLLLLLALLACSPFVTFASAQDGIQYKSSTVTKLTAGPNPGYIGQKISLQASVTAASGGTVTSGSVTFTVNSAVLGTAPLNSSGVATLESTSASAAAGSYSLVATYTGSSSFSDSSSPTVSFTLKRPSNSSTSLSVSPNPATIGQNVILTASVAGGGSSGTVNFSVNGYSLGTSAVSGGVAKLSVPTSDIAPGNYPVIAKYSGSGTESPSSSSSVLAVLDSSGSTGASGTPLSACADLTKSGSYYLTQNVSSSGTCFFVDADNITLNLNGHTVTFGTGGGTLATPGFVLADSWYTAPGYNLAQTGSTNAHAGFVLYGGSVIAATNSGQRSTCIWVGQSDDINPAPVMHDLILTTYAEDASPIFGTGSHSGWQIYNNTINYASVTTSSRYDFYGYAIWIGDQLNAPGNPPDAIYNNKIIGAPQGGIYDDDQNAVIGPSNDITFNSFYANDYCVIDYAGNGQIIKNNVCHPASGRGIDVESANVQVLDNTITVTELPQDAEYGGCEEGGADGIRVRDNYPSNPTAPTNVLIQGNNITANATVCQANGLRFTQLVGSNGDNVTLTGNTITTTGAGTGAIPDYGISFDGVNQPTMTFNNNSFTSHYAFVEVDWDGANVAINSQQNWLNTPSVFVDNENGYDDQADSGPTFSQSIMVDNSAGGTIKCGNSAAGPTQVGSTIKVCN
jgi:hypothetical protein